MRGTRVLRYVGNREKPEAEVYNPVERWARRCEPISSQTFLGLDDATLLKIAKSIPNPMFSDFHKDEGGTLFTPNNPSADMPPIFWLANPTPFMARIRRERPHRQAEVDFEVNMMEALVGWKSWEINGRTGILHTQEDFEWTPDIAAEAKCVAHCTKIPAEHHTCGIYGADSPGAANGYGEVVGRVHGWGRYIRHEGGWKAQFAYPRCFYLREQQMNLVDLLKQYHVPIYVSQPVQMYDPSEEGYDGYWNQEENGSSRAYQESASGEARSSSEDDED